ncbi:hypothetical protein LZ554_002798 [Drepanopeziza brunnea f. sp. 'monogermtubi']|nr:hypothetical protein LZ554_002798 [Drepanopeziza brunnea f. sp. 'monogermtubi']
MNAGGNPSGPVEQPDEVQVQVRIQVQVQVQPSALNLSQAIFIPFKGFERGPQPVLDHVQRLQKTVEHVTAQQAIVRGNMVSVAQHLIDRVVVNAKSELLHLYGDDDDFGNESEDEDQRAQRRAEEAVVWKSLRAKAPEGADKVDYQIQAGRGRSETGSVALTADGDVEMGGVGGSRPSSSGSGSGSGSSARTPHAIRKDAALAIQRIISETSNQLDAYDKRSVESLAHYKRSALRSSTSSKDSPISPTTDTAQKLNSRSTSSKNSPASPTTDTAQKLRSRSTSSKNSPASPTTELAQKLNTVKFIGVVNTEPTFTPPVYSAPPRLMPIRTNIPPGILKRRSGDTADPALPRVTPLQTTTTTTITVVPGSLKRRSSDSLQSPADVGSLPKRKYSDSPRSPRTPVTPVDLSRRTSTGMPFAGLKIKEPERNRESIGSLRR